MEKKESDSLEHIDTKNHHTFDAPPAPVKTARSGKSPQKTPRSVRDVGIAAAQRTLQGVGRHYTETRKSADLTEADSKDFDKVVASLGHNTPPTIALLNAHIGLIDGYGSRLHRADPNPVDSKTVLRNLTTLAAVRDGLTTAWNKRVDKATKAKKAKGKSA